MPYVRKSKACVLKVLFLQPTHFQWFTYVCWVSEMIHVRELNNDVREVVSDASGCNFSIWLRMWGVGQRTWGSSNVCETSFSIYIRTPSLLSIICILRTLSPSDRFSHFLIACPTFLIIVGAKIIILFLFLIHISCFWFMVLHLDKLD